MSLSRIPRVNRLSRENKLHHLVSVPREYDALDFGNNYPHTSRLNNKSKCRKYFLVGWTHLDEGPTDLTLQLTILDCF